METSILGLTPATHTSEDFSHMVDAYINSIQEHLRPNPCYRSKKHVHRLFVYVPAV